MSNPTQISYKLPTENVDGSPLQGAIKQVNIGIRPKSGTAGTYSIIDADITFAADAQGISHEPLAAFGILAPGDYMLAAQTLMVNGGISAWSPEAPLTIEVPPPPVPKAPSLLTVS